MIFHVSLPTENISVLWFTCFLTPVSTAFSRMANLFFAEKISIFEHITNHGYWRFEWKLQIAFYPWMYRKIRLLRFVPVFAMLSDNSSYKFRFKRNVWTLLVKHILIKIWDSDSQSVKHNWASSPDFITYIFEIVCLRFRFVLLA